jgi:hypothetical protein
MEALDVAPYKLTERRIARLTPLIGVIASACTAYFASVRMGAGILAGAMVAWIGFHWLESALDGLVRVSTAQAGSGEAGVPIGAILKIFGRYALMAGVVYVTFFIFKVPVVSLLLGLCALGAATVVAVLYELWRPAN